MENENVGLKVGGGTKIPMTPLTPHPHSPPTPPPPPPASYASDWGKGGARCNSLVELMVRCVVGSIPHGGPIELFRVQASVQQTIKRKKAIIQQRRKTILTDAITTVP